MRVRRLFVLALLSLAFSVGAEAGERFTTMHVADLARLVDSKAPLFIYDANVESTREHVGIIPGARLIEATDELAGVLPPDKKSQLVFYCANTYCTASHIAANRALDAGYTNVGVLVDGIYGWRDAKQSVRKIAAAPHALLPRDVQSLLGKHAAVVVDVREGEERHEVVDQAVWMPMSKIEDPKQWAAFVQTLPKDKLVVFYCAVGVRAKRSAILLRTDGFATAYFDGPDQWKAAGLPVKQGPAL